MDKKILVFPVLLLFLISSARAQPIRKVSTSILGIKQTESGAEGVVANLTVQLREGGGEVFISSMPLTEIDTQASARLAKETACDTLNKDCSQYDFNYIIRSSAPIVGGPSAGSAMTVATLSLLLNRSLNSSVMISGTVNPDGSIGAVGGLLEKTRAAYRAGEKMVLIPEGQRVIRTTKTQREKTGPIVTEITQTEKIDLQKYASEQWGIEVREVSDIREAYKYFTGYEIVSPEVEGELETPGFNEVLEDMFTSMYNRTQTSLKDLKENKKKYALSLSMDQRIDKLIGKIEEDITKIKDLKRGREYYSAASMALEANVKIRYGLNLIKYSRASSKKVYVNTKIEEISSELRKLERNLIQGRKVRSGNEIEVVTTSIARLREAETLLDEASKNYYNEKYQESIYSFSFSKERLKTAEEWVSIGEGFEDKLNVSFKVSKLKDLAQERMSEAQNKEIYVSTMGIKPGQASAHLQRAQEAYETEDYVYSIFESLKSIAISNLRMEIRGVEEQNLDSVIQNKRKRVRSKLESVKQKGILPILSTSYLQFSENKEDKLTKLIYLEYANQFSSLADNILNSLKEKESIQRSEPEIKEWERPEERFNIQEGARALVLVLLGICLGLITGVFLERKFKIKE